MRSAKLQCVAPKRSTSVCDEPLGARGHLFGDLFPISCEGENHSLLLGSRAAETSFVIGVAQEVAEMRDRHFAGI